MASSDIHIKGRGAQANTANKYLRQHYVHEHVEGLDEELYDNSATEYLEDFPKKIINVVESDDVPFGYSMNPYQGCEHGCIYCYARTTHTYWGYSAGLDFERKIITKPTAPLLLAKEFAKKSFVPGPIMLSGNTDCYQPIERKLGITRKILEVCLKYGNPVSIITKNALILRDIDLLQALAAKNLVHVSVSITSLKETTRQLLEPRTATAQRRLHVVSELSKMGIPINVMVAPVIPGLNSDEISNIIEAAAKAGAKSAGYTIVRLNGDIAQIFEEWISQAMPDAKEKILNQIRACHNGNLHNYNTTKRMSGDGAIADSIKQLFKVSCKKYFGQNRLSDFDLSHFTHTPGSKQMTIF